MNISELLQKKEKKYDRELIITKNTLQCDKKVAQLSNISIISIERDPPAVVSDSISNLMSIAIVVLLAPKNSLKIMDPFLINLIAGIVIGYCAILIGLVIRYNKDLKTYLVVNLNSGKNLCFYCIDESFLSIALEDIKECIDKNQSGKIDFIHCKFVAKDIKVVENN